MKKIYRSAGMLAGFAALLSMTACEQPLAESEKIVLDIPAIANKTPEEVVAALGQPDSVYLQKRGRKKVAVQLYKPHQIEIYFPAGKASEILVNKPAPLPYHERALSSFNIEPRSPDQANDNAAIKWSNIQGFKYITFFSHQIQADTVSDFKIFFNLADTTSAAR